MGNPKPKKKCHSCGYVRCKCKYDLNKLTIGESHVVCKKEFESCESSQSCSSSSSSCSSSSETCSPPCESSSSTCESSSSTCESSSSSCKPNCKNKCCKPVICDKSEECDDGIVRVKGVLPNPACRECVNTYLLASCIEVDELISPPTIMIQARDCSWHFPGEIPPGYPFWLIISPNKSLLLAMPQQTSCHFPLGSHYVLTFQYV